ncbi:MAG: HEAT repeat domain-containing protein [Candidatus Hydrogenedentes bacterium]|nr:HEAT repeat domain-containing protein [Candidatus Hydrogenedentota bacterium]
MISFRADSVRNCIALLVWPCQIAALVTFGFWFSKTDILFGHYHGPFQVLLVAMGFAGASVVGEVIFLWLVFARRARGAHELPVPRRRKVLRILHVIASGLMLFPMAIILFVGTSEWPRGMTQLRRERFDSRKAVTASNLPELIEALGDSDYVVRSRAARALAELGPEAAPAVPALVALLERRDDFAMEAAMTLGAIGPAAKEAIPALVEAAEQGSAVPVEEGRDALRVYAGEALGRIGPAALPDLITLLSHRNPDIRVCAAEALGQMSEKARDAVGSLRARLTDEDEEVGKAAAAALKHITFPVVGLP